MMVLNPGSSIVKPLCILKWNSVCNQAELKDGALRLCKMKETSRKTSNMNTSGELAPST